MGSRNSRKGEAIALVIFLAIGLTALSGTFGFEALEEVFAVLGFVVALPLVAILGEKLPFVTPDEDESVASTTDSADTENESDDPLAKLRDRYARGEIDEVEFERRLEGLLETEDIDSTVESERDTLAELE